MVIQIAKEFDAMLVSLDKEMVEKVKTIVKIMDIGEMK